MLNKEHRILEGIQKAVIIRSSLNLGLSKNLKEAYPKIIPMKKLENCTKNNTVHNNLYLEWVAGFFTGESNLFIVIPKSKTNNGLYTSLRFLVSQHSRDLLSLENFANFFGGSSVVNCENHPLCEFVVAKFDIIFKNVIPFFL